MAARHDVILLTLAWLSHVFSDMGEQLPAPINLNVTSSNFNPLLTWQPGPGTPSGVSYNVSFNSDWHFTWHPVAGCVLVEHPLVCNLTGAFTKSTYVYYTMVVAVPPSQAAGEAFQPSPASFTSGFKPIADGELALPQLTLSACDQFLCVDIQPPLETLRHIYQQFNYRLRVTSRTGGQPVEFEVNRRLGRNDLRDLAPGREYCVSVCILDSLAPRYSVYSQPQCTSTTSTGVYAEDVFTSVILCVLAVLILGTVVLLERTGVVCLRNPMPSVLTLFRPLGEERLAVSRKEILSSYIHISAMAPSAGGRGKRATSEDAAAESVDEADEVSTSAAVKVQSEYELRAGSSSSLLSSSSTSSSSFSTSPLLAAPCQSERPSQGHVNPHMCPRLAPPPPLHRLSCDRDQRFTAPHSAAAVAAIAAETETETEAEGCDDVNLLSLTFGSRGEGWAPRATPPPTATEDEVAMETVVSVDNEDEEVDEEEPGGYLRR